MVEGFNARLAPRTKVLLAMWFFFAIGAALPASAALGQPPPVSASSIAAHDSAPSHRWAVVLGVGLLVSLGEDRQIDRFMRHHPSRGFDALARDVDPFGRAEYIKPALAAAIVLPFVAGRRDLARSAVRVAISYFAADGVESLLKPVVGRHRPDSTEQSFRFHPFVNQETWHSFPSAHTTHAFALAEAVSMETDSQWIKQPAFAIATLVGAQRVYKQAHWTSDVVASAVFSTVVSRAAERYLRDRLR